MKANQTQDNRVIPLRIVLIVPFMLQIFGAVGLGYLSFKNGQKAVSDLAEQLIDKTSQQINTHLDSYLTLPIQLVQMNVDAISQGEVNLDNPNSSGRFFWRQAKAFPNLTYTGFAGTDGSEIGAGRWVKGLDLLLYENRPNGKASDYMADSQGNQAALLQQYEYNPLGESWYQKAVLAQTIVWGKPEVAENLDIQFTQAGEALQTKGNKLDGGIGYYVAASAAAPVYDRDRNLLGVVNVDLSLTSLSNFLRTFQVSPAGQVFIMERDGMLVGSSSPFPILEGESESLRRLTGLDSPDPLIQTVSQAMQRQFSSLQMIQSEQEWEISFHGERHFVQVTPWRDKHGLDWLVVMVVPESDFMA